MVCQGDGGLFENLAIWNHTRLEGRERVFMVQRGQNSSRRFVKLIEYGIGLGKGILVIFEGWRGCGWACFVRNSRDMVGSSSSVSAYVNRFKEWLLEIPVVKRWLIQFRMKEMTRPVELLMWWYC